MNCLPPSFARTLHWLLLLCALGLGIQADGTPSLPSAFDLAYESEVTPSCNAFFQRFLSSADFRACKPLSFFITNSYEFAARSRAAPYNALMLEEICTTPKVDCQKVMREFRQEMVKMERCGQDLRAQNPLANSVYVSFINFHLMQRVGCVKDEQEQSCFVEALEGRANLNLYFMPYGHLLSPVDNSTAASSVCTLCTSKVMDLYGRFGSQYRSPLGRTYKPSKDIIIEQCGRSFLKAHKQPANEGAARRRLTSLVGMLVGVVTAAMLQ